MLLTHPTLLFFFLIPIFFSGLLFVLLCIVDGLKYPQIRKTRISELQHSTTYTSNTRLNDNYTENSPPPTGNLNSIKFEKIKNITLNDNSMLTENEMYPQIKKSVFQNGIVTKGFIPLQFESQFSPREKYGSLFRNDKKIPNKNINENNKKEMYRTDDKYNKIGENDKLKCTVFPSTNPFDSPVKENERENENDVQIKKCNLNDNNMESNIKNNECITKFGISDQDDDNSNNIINSRNIQELPVDGVLSRLNKSTPSVYDSLETIEEIADDYENEKNETNTKDEKSEKILDQVEELGSKIPHKTTISRNPSMESELAKHHPLSPYYFEIVGQKILFLFFSSSCVLFFWILQFPQLFTVPFGDALKINGSVSTVSCTFGFIISVCTGFWFFFLLQVNYSTITYYLIII